MDIGEAIKEQLALNKKSKKKRKSYLRGVKWGSEWRII